MAFSQLYARMGFLSNAQFSEVNDSVVRAFDAQFLLVHCVVLEYV